MGTNAPNHVLVMLMIAFLNPELETLRIECAESYAEFEEVKRKYYECGAAYIEDMWCARSMWMTAEDEYCELARLIDDLDTLMRDP